MGTETVPEPLQIERLNFLHSRNKPARQLDEILTDGPRSHYKRFAEDSTCGISPEFGQLPSAYAEH
jgi:hypothetical protein